MMRLNNNIINVVQESIQKAVYEELSISSAVQNAANRLKTVILQDLKHVFSKTDYINQYIANKEEPIKSYYTYKENNFKFNVFDHNVSVNYTVYTSGANLIQNKLFGRTDYIDGDFNLILNLSMFNGQPVANYFDNTIYHELLHIYQYTVSKKMMLNNYEKKIYNAVKDVFENKNSTDIEIIFANALFSSFDFEQDAMAHGLYGLLMANKDRYLFWESLINKSDEFKYLTDLKYCIQNIDDYPDIFYISKETALHRFEHAYSRFQNKIGKIYVKAKEEIRHGELLEDF